MTGDHMPINKPSSAPIVPAPDVDPIALSPWLTVAIALVLVGLLSSCGLVVFSVGQWMAGGVK